MAVLPDPTSGGFTVAVDPDLEDRRREKEHEEEMEVFTTRGAQMDLAAPSKQASLHRALLKAPELSANPLGPWFWAVGRCSGV